MSLSFCNFLTITQRMCMAVSPWTMMLMAWLDWDEKQEHSLSPKIKKDSGNLDAKMTEAEILRVRNLPQFPPCKTSILSIMEEEQFQEHHKYKLSIIWGMSLLCGLCSEQALDQSKNPPCSLTRRLSSPVEIVSILLTQPVPAILTLSLCILSFNLSLHNHRTRTIVILSILYIITILPSLLAELMDNGGNISIIILLKFNLASIHIIFEPVVILYMRPDLQAALGTVWKREKNICT